MKKMLCLSLALALALVLLSGCSFFEEQAKHAVYNYNSYSDDTAFVTAALDDLNTTAQESTEAYTKLLITYARRHIKKEGVVHALQEVFLDKEADCIRRLDAYNLLSYSGPDKDQRDYWQTVLDEPILLPETVVDDPPDDQADGDTLRYFCVFRQNGDTTYSKLPITPYTTLSALSGIPRNQLASSVDQADRFFLCDITYSVTKRYSISGSGSASINGYSAEMIIYLRNCHGTWTSQIGQYSFDPPDSFESYGAPTAKYADINYTRVAGSIEYYFDNMGLGV